MVDVHFGQEDVHFGQVDVHFGQKDVHFGREDVHFGRRWNYTNPLLVRWDAYEYSVYLNYFFDLFYIHNTCNNEQPLFIEQIVCLPYLFVYYFLSKKKQNDTVKMSCSRAIQI
jgi:hypothetical protein